MQKQVLSLSLLHLFSLMFSLSLVPSANSFIYAQCSNVYFNSNTPYELNLNSLFTSLVNSASSSNFNESQISSPPPANPQTDVVYGLFQCQGNLSYSGCQGCVANSVSQLKKTCPLSTVGTIQLEEGCFVKYDNASFFGVEDKTEVLKRCGPQTAGYNSDAMVAVLANLNAGNGQPFRVSASGSVQGVAQCVQDLSVSDCEDCVSEARVRLRSECETSTWGDMFLGKCYIRYVDHGFQPRKGSDDNNNNNNNNIGSSGNYKSTIRDIGILIAMLFGVANFGNVYHIRVVQRKTKRKTKKTSKKLKEVVKAEAARIKAKEDKRRAKEAYAASVV